MASTPYTPEFKPIELPLSEDCLSLNIWTPAQAADEKLPVLLWIHGGAFRGGCGCVPVNDGSRLAAKGILVVTINYRVGPIGFLAHPELSRESGHNASGNYGLLDQIAALQWVQQNIAAFGGDPRKVTIGGQSAGATSVHDLIASPLARDLFRGAISASRYNMGYPDKALAAGEREGIELATANGARTLAELRALPADTLQLAPAPRPKRDATTNPLAGREARFAFVPVVDGWVLPADPEVITAQRQQNDTPVLIGITANESNDTLTAGFSPQAFRNQLQAMFGVRSGAAAALYPATTAEEAAIMGRTVRLDRGLASLDAWANERLKASARPIFMYVFTRNLPVANGPSHGAFHAAEMPYAFDTLQTSSRPFTATDHTLAAAMSGYWVNFVKHGDPNGAGLERWPAFDTKQSRLMQLGDAIEARTILEPRKRELFQAYAADRGRLSVF